MQNKSSKSPTFTFSPEATAQNRNDFLANPITLALSRATQKRWRVFDGRIAQELCAPYCVFDLPVEVQAARNTHADFTKLPPFTFQVEMDEPKFAA